jgi:hypothetical protein
MLDVEGCSPVKNPVKILLVGGPEKLLGTLPTRNFIIRGKKNRQFKGLLGPLRSLTRTRDSAQNGRKP